MADFVQTRNTKSAVRKLTRKIPDIGTFDAIVQDVLTNNPWGCVDYVQGGVTHDGVAIASERYTLRLDYENGEAEKVGEASFVCPTVAAYNQLASDIATETVVSGAMGGSPVRRPDDDLYYVRFRCHDAGGEIYYVTISRDRVRLTSYEDDAIRNTLEAWADGVMALA
ncbi:MAG: hypothetical protein ACXQTG_04340 [Methanoculleaceae archaeon]